MNSWAGGVWNMVFVGSKNAPPSHCSNSGGIPTTNIAATPIIAEKPYIVFENNKYLLMRPNVEHNKVGVTSNYNNAQEIDFSHVYVASEKDSAATINSKLSQGLHLVLQPGIYHLTEPIVVNNPNTVVLGMGLVTLVSANGNSCLEVGNVDGVRIAGILFQAGPSNADTLLRYGNGKCTGDSNNPGVMSDIFARVGGPDSQEVKTSSMVKINCDNVIVDDAWLWRADHSVSGSVANSRNPVQSGLIVNSNNVKAYGLAVEHTLGNMLEWNGENGETYFFQAEYPYDVTQQNYGDLGFAAYKVADRVQNHKAFGVGVYSYFRDHAVTVESGFHTPSGSGIKFTNALTVFLNGQGGIKHVIDEQGNSVKAGAQIAYQCNFGGMEQPEELFF
jgi:hypothetical protein